MGNEKIRVSQHSGRTGGGGHNDRSFLEKLPEGRETNIDMSRSDGNMYWSWMDDLDEAEFKQLLDQMPEKDLDISSEFTSEELTYYRATFQTALDRQNEKHLQGGHRNRVKTMEQIHASKRYCPEEVILQIGRMGNTVDSDLFAECVNEYTDYLNEWNESHGKPMKILNAAIHVDEATPHMHMRRVWQYSDEGVTRIGQEEALKRAGVGLPNPNAANGQHNNRKMTFDKMMREKWIQICAGHGLEIETEPIPDSHHISTKAYARRQEAGRREKEAKLKEDQEAFERRCAQKEVELSKREAAVRGGEARLAKRIHDVDAREHALTRSEAQIDAKLSRVDRTLCEAENALKTAQSASEGALDVTMESWMRTHSAMNPVTHRKESHYDIISRAVRADRNKALSKGFTAVDRVKMQYDQMMQSNEGRDDWQFGN